MQRGKYGIHYYTLAQSIIDLSYPEGLQGSQPEARDESKCLQISFGSSWIAVCVTLNLKCVFSFYSLHWLKIQLLPLVPPYLSLSGLAKLQYLLRIYEWGKTRYIPRVYFAISPRILVHRGNPHWSFSFCCCCCIQSNLTNCCRHFAAVLYDPLSSPGILFYLIN